MKKPSPIRDQAGAELAISALDLAHQFQSQIHAAHAANPPARRAPAAIVQQVVRRSIGAPKTKEQARRMDMEKNGFDPATGQYFETATQAKQYRRAHGVVELSHQEFNTEMAGKGSAVRTQAPLPTEGVVGFDANAFSKGEAVANQMFGGRHP